MDLGDLAFYVGIVGIIIYLCLMIIRYTMTSGKISEAGKRYEERITYLQQKVEELRAERDQKNPEVDEIVEKVVGLRETRDKLQIQYEEMLEQTRERGFEIKTKVR